MKMYDCHLHLSTSPGQDSPEALVEKIHAAGLAGAAVLSDPPNSFIGNGEKVKSTRERFDLLFATTDQDPGLYPFYWIDPTEPTALEQVDMAVERGVVGFKVICNSFFPGDGRPMQVWTYIASKNKPILFHSGILYGYAADSQYNRPVGFEPLLFIPGLKFAMAHISWPWCDELMAVFGKWNALKANVTLGDQIAEMYIDVTPGTPPIYREDALKKLFFIGYERTANIMFGVDNIASQYNTQYAKDWIGRDLAIYEKLGISKEQIESVFSGAFMRFIGR
ncbi:MAG: amidohydrolase family protein [Clostridiaceae bacterium]|nr:amidohydrolase family protein [Clostridiaceae bacterium]